MLTGIAPQLSETEFKAFCKTVKGHATTIRRIGKKHGLDQRPDNELYLRAGYGREFSGHVFSSMEAKQSWTRSNCHRLHQTNGFSGANPEDFGAVYHEILPCYVPRIEAADKEVTETLSVEEMSWVMALCEDADLPKHRDPRYQSRSYHQLLENCSFFPYWSRGSTRNSHARIKATLEKHGHKIVATPDEVDAQLEKRKQKAKKALDKNVRSAARAIESLKQRVIEWQEAHQKLVDAASRFEDEWHEDYEVPRANIW